MTIWEILQIQETKNKKEIKKAYATQLKHYHPEEDPENFKLLQEAYQKAMAYANENHTDQPIHTLSKQEKKEDTIKASDQVISEPINIHVDETLPAQENTLLKTREQALFTKEHHYDTPPEDYVIQNILSRLQKTLTYESLMMLFEDSMVKTYFHNTEFKNTLDQGLKKKKYTGSYEEFGKMVTLLNEKGLEKTAKRVNSLYKTYYTVGSPIKKIQIFFAIIIAFVSVGFNLIVSGINNSNEPEVQKEKIEDPFYKQNESYLHGYYFTKEDVYYDLIDPNDDVVMEDILIVKYTMSPYLVFVKDDSYILFDTKTQKEKNLDYDNVVVFDQKDSDIKYLACLKGNTWYLCDVDGTQKEVIQGDIKQASYIDFIDGIPYFISASQ